MLPRKPRTKLTTVTSRSQPEKAVMQRMADERAAAKATERGKTRKTLRSCEHTSRDHFKRHPSRAAAAWVSNVLRCTAPHEAAPEVGDTIGISKDVLKFGGDVGQAHAEGIVDLHLGIRHGRHDA